MINLQQIAEPVREEFELFREAFLGQISSETPLLQAAINQVLKTNGKHIRPLLLLLTAKACGKTSEQSHSNALIIEMLHTATLIHDDVVDETKQRRNGPSLNAVFDNRIAVLTGDYMLACVLKKAAEAGNINIITILSQICRNLSEGELMQLENADNHIFNEECYLKMIAKKTSSLISASAEIGAISASAAPEIIVKCRHFGEFLGYCFQIKDDIFDYYDDVAIGKPTGNDIREGKITLPLIFALNEGDKKTAVRCREIIEKKDFTPENIALLIDFAKKSGGIKYAEKALAEYKLKAVELIKTLPESASRNSLLLLADYFANRTF